MTADEQTRAAATANLERALGEALLFLGAHPLYEQLFLEDIEARILAPLLLRQFRLIRDEDGGTLAFVSWAKMGEESLQRLKNGGQIAREDWHSGGETVIVDAVAPTPEMALKAAEKVSREVLDGGRVLVLRMKPNRVIEAVNLEMVARKGKN